MSEFLNMQRLMQSDAEYAWAWHCNLAMPIMDVAGCDHKTANEAAAHLMQHIWSVDITTDPRYVYGKSDAQQYAEFRIALDAAEDEELRPLDAAPSNPPTQGDA